MVNAVNIIIGQNFLLKKGDTRHINNPSRISGRTYSFENQNLITFEDNYSFNDNLFLFAYYSFEICTTAIDHVDVEVIKCIVFPTFSYLRFFKN